MLRHPLANFEKQRHHTLAIDGAFVINFDEYKSVRTHWNVLYMNRNKTTYFDSFGVEYIPKEIQKVIGNENITYLE